MTASLAPPVYAVAPFVFMLLAIAVGPLWVPHWWESNRHKLLVAAALGLPILALYLARRPSALVGMAEEYVSFMVLLAGLYAIAGGIRLTGDLEATPLTNTAFLGLGALLASFVGTTGASMLLIRPVLQTNRERRRVKHTVIFFIFLVSNVGGMLTPLGDPPLFLGTASPMVEVAVLFFGIFLTMIPALELLRVRGGELGVREPWQFFWAAGSLSSFLDNAPTYLAFLALGQGLHLPNEVAGVTHVVLAAISVGSVAMGANSYIGNAPNFMVKSIAEEAKIPMPSFFGYMLYSGAILLPLFAIVTLLFFR